MWKRKGRGRGRGRGEGEGEEPAVWRMETPEQDVSSSEDEKVHIV